MIKPFQIKSKPSLFGDSIALADIVINLFVFFFITFGLYAQLDPAKNGSFPIQLPKAGSAAIETQARPLTVSIHPGGTIYLRSKAIPLKELKSAVDRDLSVRKDKRVLIQADQSLSLQTFVSVLDVVKATQAQSVAIETKIDR